MLIQYNQNFNHNFIQIQLDKGEREYIVCNYTCDFGSRWVYVKIRNRVSSQNIKSH